MNNITNFLRDAANAEEFVGRYFAYMAELLSRMETATIAAFIGELETARVGQHTVFVAGNGGSASTASHMATDLSFGTRMGGLSPPFRVLALTDNAALMTAAANDECYEDIFVSQLRIHYRPGDYLVVISASGNSTNVLRAAQWVRGQGGRVLGLVGFDGGMLKDLCDVLLHVRTPKGEYGPVEDLHLMLNHVVAAWLRHRAHVEQGFYKPAAI